MKKRVVSLLLVALCVLLPVFADVDWVVGKVLSIAPHEELDIPYVSSLVSGSRINRNLTYPATLEFAVEYTQSEYHPLDYNIYLYGDRKTMIPARLGYVSTVDVVISNDDGDVFTLKAVKREAGNRIHFNEKQAYALSSIMMDSDSIHMEIDNGSETYVFNINTRNYGKAVTAFMKVRKGRTFDLDQLRKPDAALAPFMENPEPLKEDSVADGIVKHADSSVDVAVPPERKDPVPVETAKANAAVQQVAAVPAEVVKEEAAPFDAAVEVSVPGSAHEGEIPEVHMEIADREEEAEEKPDKGFIPHFSIMANVYDPGMSMGFPGYDFSFTGGLSLDLAFMGKRNGAAAEVAYSYTSNAHVIEANASYNRRVPLGWMCVGPVANIILGNSGQNGYRFGGRISYEVSMNFDHFMLMFGVSNAVLSPVVLGELDGGRFDNWDWRVALLFGLGVCF